MSRNRLILDVGNTQTKFAVFNDEGIVSHSLFSDDELLQFIQSNNPDDVIVSSVRKVSFTKKITDCFVNPLLLNRDTTIPITNLYKTPATLGNDRLANAVGAFTIFPSQNSLIIDVGTCLKLDFINESNEYLGGSISPGLRMRFKALHTLTDNLPLIEDVEINQLIGKDTTSSIQVGAYKGMVAEISNMIGQYEQKYDNLNVILTGGDLSWFLDVDLSQKNSIFADQLLTLKGLNTILKYNVQK